MKIPVGKEDFEEIRRNHSCYIDKTELIYELIEGTDTRYPSSPARAVLKKL